LNNFGGTVIFERNGVSNNNRVTWEIWEYTGPISGNNEMAVLDRGVCTFNPSSLTCDGVVIPSGANDNNDFVVFVTGHGNADNNRKEGQYCWITSEWVAGSNLPRFTRGEAGGFSPNAACDVSYAVVEFKGTNWNVQRVEHIFSGSVVQPHTILNVVDISKAFFHTQQRNNPGNNFDGLCQAGSEVELVGPTTLEYRLPLDTTNWGPDMKAVTWVVWNTQAAGQVLKVNHYNSAKLAGGPAENNWQEIINPLTYSISESAIGGFSGQSANCGIGFPKGYINARLTNPTTVDLWQSDPGQNQEYTFQVIEFPTASISNNAPTLSITSINQGNPVDLFPGGTAPIEIQFNVQDLDGLVDLDQDTLLITFGFPSGGPFTETETAVITDCPTLTDIGNTRFYTCLNDMLYYDHFGTWDAFVSIDDFSGDNGQDTDQFEVLKLLDISLTPESIDFPDVLPGDVIEALIPTVVTNNGNVEVPLDADLEIAGFPLVGQFIGDSISPTQFKAAGSLAAGRVCDELISIPEGVPIVIPTVFLQRGPVGNTENLDFCLDTPFGISNDHYNTAFGEQPWEISLVSFASGLAIAGRRRKKKKPISSKKTEILENLLEDLLSILKERKTLVTESIQIPLSIFKSKLSPAEAVCKFLKENIGKKFNEIANLINRNQRTIWINYNNSIKKQKNKLVVPDDDITVPVSIFENREMSILESIVSYLSQEDYSNKEISKILGKSPNNVWTLIKRVKEKLGNEKDF
jgi:DNA-binding CsgD family transcriptional regulator